MKKEYFVLGLLVSVAALAAHTVWASTANVKFERWCDNVHTCLVVTLSNPSKIGRGEVTGKSGHILDYDGGCATSYTFQVASVANPTDFPLTFAGNHCPSGTYSVQLDPRVGGSIVPIDKFALLAPYISLAFMIATATLALFYVRRVKNREEKQ